MPYVDGFVLAVPEANIAAYKKMSSKAGKIWMEHGALSYVECVADDVPEGKTPPFPRAVNLKEGEVVVFSWITYKSRAHRDAVLKKVMSDPRLQNDMKNMPFDTKRMIYGGFKSILDF